MVTFPSRLQFMPDITDDEEQTEGQDNFVQQPAKQKAVSKAFEQKVVEDDDVHVKVFIEPRKAAFKVRIVKGEKQLEWTDDIKPVEGISPDQWVESQRDTLRWYPVHLDGRAMCITRDSGIIDYVKPGTRIPCAKEDSDVRAALRAYNERTGK